MSKFFYRIILFVLPILGLWALDGYEDRLYLWTDNKGVSHISKNPPPPNARSKSVLDYRPQTSQQDQDVLQKSQTGSEERETVEAAQKTNERTPAEPTENVEPEYFDDDEVGYRRQLDRYDARAKALDSGENWQENGRQHGGPIRVEGGRR
jgi:hypothetical protein